MIRVAISASALDRVQAALQATPTARMFEEPTKCQLLRCYRRI